jgi:hypothetical protein
MTRDATRQLSLAASSRKIGYAFFVGREVVDWGTARKASRSVEGAYAQALRWVDFYVPARLFIEAIDGGSRKGRHTIALIGALAAAGEAQGIAVIAVPRRMHHKNKYVEAEALARGHPHLAPWVPKARRYWTREPMQMGIFEAVALVEQWYADEDNRGSREVFSRIGI